MAERASMPTFVPRTVASFERAATVMARRVAAPVRMLAVRALSFADRLVGTWAGTGPATAGFDGGARPAMRAATRGGAMPLPRPWYEVDADEDAIWPQQAARAVAAMASTSRAGTAAAPAPAVASPASVAAERGAAIARTAVTAPPESVARRFDVAADAAETRELSVSDAATLTDVRAAEALGLHAPNASVPPIAATAAATRPTRATTPLARALAHAAWVDAQLRVAAPVETSARAVGGLVFVAPADVERPMTAVDAAAREPSRGERTIVEAAEREQVIREAARAQASAATAQPAMPSAAVASWSSRLPDPRLSATMPTPIAQRVAEFVARLAGVQSARDAAPPATDETAAVVAAATRPSDAATTAPRTSAERTYVVLTPPSIATASWRPGAAGARIEQLSARVDARAMVAWGLPATTAMPTTATGARELPAIERTYVAPAEPPARATGVARLSQFVQQLVGVQAARATAPLAVQPLVAAIERAGEPVGRPAAPASERAPQRVTLAATTANAANAAAVFAADGARATTPWATAMMPGAIARRAEQLGGAVGVRAASLSIDFVDPARLSLFAGAAPSMPTVAPVEAAPSPASDTIMPAPRPLFATSSMASAAPSLTAEEWSLVATFPSAATAMQLAAARQARHWTAPERTMLSAIAAGEGTMAARGIERGVATGGRTIAARGGAPAEYVAPTVAAAETDGRLPGGRTPRGSFTWPKLADASLARAEWTAPAIVTVAEQTKQTAPGTPLWGALPPLVTVSPSLAASAPSVAAAAGTTASGGAREGLRADAALTTTTVASASATASGEAASTRASRGDAPAMTLMTAAATREARATARMGARADASGEGAEAGDARSAQSLPMTAAGGERAPVVGVSNVRPVTAMPLMTAGPTPARDAAGATAGPAARALDLARPFLKLIEGGVAGAGIGGDGGSRSSGAPRFYEQPQPVVAGAPSSDSASRIVEALRSQPATPSSDDRVSLADLTLIAIASATQQVAASPAGGGPSGAGAAAAAPAAAPAPDGGHGGGKSENPAQQIEELARAAFDELQRLIALAHERSGHHG